MVLGVSKAAVCFIVWLVAGAAARCLSFTEDTAGRQLQATANPASIQALKGVTNLTNALDENSGCIVEEHSNYVGTVVANIGNVSDAAACCKLAEEHAEANAWTYCPNPNSCDAKYYQFAYRQCNLKKQKAVADGFVPFLYEQASNMPLSSGLPPKTWAQLSERLKGNTMRPNVREAGSSGCLAQRNTVYDGIIIQDGLTNIQDDEAACCKSCRDNPQCNVWVYCPLQETYQGQSLTVRSGCRDAVTGIVATPKSCTLKYQAPVSMVSAAPVVVGEGTSQEKELGRGPNITFTSGTPIMLANTSAGNGFNLIGFRDIPLGDIPCPDEVEYENAWQGPYCRVVNRTVEELAALCLDVPKCMGFAYLKYGDGNSFVTWTPVAYLKGNVTWDTWFNYLNNNYTQRQAVAYYTLPINETEAAQQRAAAGTVLVAPAPPSTGTSSGLSTGAIVGIVLGSVAVLALVLLAAFFLMRKRRQQANQAALLEKGGNAGSVYASSYPKVTGMSDTHVTNCFDVKDDMGKGRTTDFSSSVGHSDGNLLAGLLKPEQITNLQQSPRNKAILLNADHLQYPEPPVLLGKGGFGSVWAATYKGEAVAVKDLITAKSGSADDMLTRLEAIIAEVRALKHCTHPNIVKCYGMIATTTPWKLLYELCEEGDLYQALTSPNKQQWQWMSRGAQVALDVAHGLQYMHTELRMTHCDVKSHNILLKSGTAKLGDMGLVRVLKEDEEAQHHSKLPCSPAYAAPEQLLHQEVSFAIDCFSFGVVMLELLLGQPAPTNRKYPDVQPGPSCPPEIVDLVKRCMADDPTQRPKIADICTVLERHLAARAEI